MRKRGLELKQFITYALLNEIEQPELHNILALLPQKYVTGACNVGKEETANGFLNIYIDKRSDGD